MLRLNRWTCLAVLLLISSRLQLVAQSPTWSDFTPTGTGPRINSNPGAYDPASNRLIFFGGLAADGSCCTSDTWILTNANGSGGNPGWQKLAASGTPPPVRVSHSAVSDANNNRLIVFAGGQLGCGTYCVLFNDVWVLSNANGTGGTPAWTQLAPTGTPPPGRAAHRAVYDATTNRMVIFGGGNNGSDDKNDTWVLTNANGLGATPQWIQLSPTGSLPTPREIFMVGYDPVANAMTVFGGAFFDDLWILSNANGLGGTPVWQQITQNSPAPGTLANWNYGYDQATNSLIFFGGGPSFNTYRNDVWVLYNANGVGAPTWKQLIPNGAPGSPPATGVFLGTFDSNLKRLMIVPDSTNLWVLTAHPILTFPLHGMSPGENQNLTPQTAQINTVFDHTMLEAAGHFSVYGCDKKVEDFIGEVGDTKPSKFHVSCRHGYQNVTKGFKFLQGVANYSPGDPTNLYYDGHPGFDFQSDYGNQVYAAASGIVSYPTLSQVNSEGIWVGGNPDVFNVMQLDPGNGYKIFYLHMSTHTRNIATGPLTSSLTGQNFIATKTGKTAKLTPGTLPVQSPLFISGQVTLNGQPLPGVQVNLNGNVAVGANGACTASMKTDSNGNYMFVGLGSGYKYNVYISPTRGYAFAAQNPSALVPDGTSVGAGELIGLSGDAGPCFPSHLHFEVQLKTNKAVTMYPANSQQTMLVNYVPVDPYGWSPSDQSLEDPYALIPELQGAGVTNLYIWK